MIFYFSGTGNSFYAAKSTAEYNHEKLVSIAAVLNSNGGNLEFTLIENEVIGIVFPVYAWGPPAVVLEFIDKVRFNNYKDNYIFSIASCGENIGNTMKVLSSALQKKNLTLSSGFSLRMPNNYIIMGDIDTKEVQEEKLREADITLEKISKVIADRRKGVFQIVKGRVPFLLTSVIHPMFMKGASHTEKYYANDKCTGCGICEKICSLRNIKVTDKPQWGRNCTQCHACIHYCPARAVQYGKGTEKKGRYRNPKVGLQELMTGV